MIFTIDGIQIFPDNEQILLLKKCTGADRFVYNWAVNKYKTLSKSDPYPNLIYDFSTYVDKECLWIKNINKSLCEHSLKIFDLDFHKYKSYENVNYPKYKRKKNKTDSFFLDKSNFEINHTTLFIYNTGNIEIEHPINPYIDYTGLIIFHIKNIWKMSIIGDLNYLEEVI
jgi:transposase